MKFRWILTIVLVVFLVVAGVAVAFNSTNRYTLRATIPIVSNGDRPPSIKVDTLNFSYSKISFFDYFHQAKGHQGMEYKSAYIQIWGNLTDSQGKIYSQEWVYTWEANSTQKLPANAILTFVNVAPGRGTLILQFHEVITPLSLPAYVENWLGNYNVPIGE